MTTLEDFLIGYYHIEPIRIKELKNMNCICISFIRSRNLSFSLFWDIIKRLNISLFLFGLLADNEQSTLDVSQHHTLEIEVQQIQYF